MNGKAFRYAGCFFDRAHQEKGERGAIFITHRRARTKKALKALEHRHERRTARRSANGETDPSPTN